MSSNLYLVNWTPLQIVPVLNGSQLTKIPPAEAKDDYVPYSLTIIRVASESPPVGGEWCADNELVIKQNGQTQRYELADPSPGQGDTDLFLWTFPDFIVFSQRSRQVGDRHYPEP